MAEVINARQGRLRINGVHDGQCGVQDGDGRLRVAFEPNVRRRSPIGVNAVELDGRAHEVITVYRSRTTPRSYVAELVPAPDTPAEVIGG